MAFEKQFRKNHVIDREMQSRSASKPYVQNDGTPSCLFRYFCSVAKGFIQLVTVRGNMP